ncbi:MAG: orotidine-5'-phosphate decarboxylase [Chloroflexota bacterium]
MVTDRSLEVQKIGFVGRLRDGAARRKSWLCIGLDPDPSKMPQTVPHSAAGVVDFCREIIAATSPRAAAFKLNLAFFEAMGIPGWRALEQVRESVPAGTPVIADAKIGDIGNSSEAYAKAIFDVLGFDAVTLNPYVGLEALEPFTDRSGKGVFVLCKTSNPSARSLQDLPVLGEPMYIKVARMALEAETAADVGLVVGGTQPESLRAVRALSEDVVLLIPGVGAQGAKAQDAVGLGANRLGQNALISVSRHILYASAGIDFAEAAARSAAALAAETWLESDVRAV